MKTKTFFLFSLLLFVLFLPQNSFPQSVTIVPKKIIYKRPKPIADYKKSFTITRPIVKNVNAALKKKIETSIGYEKNFDFNLKEEINEVQWLEDADYIIDYNKNGILGVMLSMDGSGAYPWVNNKSVVVNLKTGAAVKPQDVFQKLNGLVALGKKAQLAEIKEAAVDIKKEMPDEDNPAHFFENSDFKIENLDDFTVSDKGVTFLYNYGFPNVVKNLQPEGRYFFTWMQLKPFIRRDGLFAKFIR